MKRIVLLRPKPNRHNNEAGFTITELVAGLLLSAMLLAGLIDITRRYAQSAERVKAVALDMRTSRMLDAAFRELSRTDAGTLRVTPTTLDAKLGSESITATIKHTPDAKGLLNWSSPTIDRSFALPESARFKMQQGLVILEEGDSGSILAIAGLKRTVAFDCQFDTVVRECRE